MIEFKNVYKTYPNGFTALKNINLQIEQGEFVAIIGLSGAGKSTILRCINRMHDISKGELTVDGVTVDSLRGRFGRGIIAPGSVVTNELMGYSQEEEE